MSAWKRTTKKGKFKNWRVRKHFKKKGEPKRNILYMPLAKKEPDGPKKEHFFFF